MRRGRLWGYGGIVSALPLQALQTQNSRAPQLKKIRVSLVRRERIQRSIHLLVHDVRVRVVRVDDECEGDAAVVLRLRCLAR